MEVKEIKKKSMNTMDSVKYDELLKKTRKEHEKLVKGMFEFTEAEGGWFDFSCRFFKGEPLQTIRLIHGEICELPMGIVKHLNNTKKKVRRFDSGAGRGLELLQNGRGIPSSYTTESRVRFTPMDVM